MKKIASSSKFNSSAAAAKHAAKIKPTFRIGGKSLVALRWYFFKIYPRDLRQAVWSFVGTTERQNQETDELILRDQDGRLYYLRDVRFESKPRGDLISLRTEWAEWGCTLDEVFASLKDIADSFGDEIERPDILK